MKIIIALLSILSSFQLFAASTCSGKAQSQLEYSRCLDAALDQAERELTTWENNHLIQLQNHNNLLEFEQIQILKLKVIVK